MDTLLAPNVVDLDPVSIRERIEHDKAKAEFTAKAVIEVGRLSKRIAYLERKHARLPISNGKRKTAAQIATLKAQREQLAEAIT